MMLQIGVGYAPRTLRALQTQPAQGLMLVLSSDDAPLEATAKAMTIAVAEPSVHAGTYSLFVDDLVRGPVCLVPPAVTERDGALVAEPGLWAYDAARGAATLTRQWLSGGTVVEDATGLSFAPAPGAAAQNIAFAETIRQNGVETSSISAPHVLPGTRPATLAVTGDATLELVMNADGAVQVAVVEPKSYAGTYTVQGRDLDKGPMWLVDPVFSTPDAVLPRAILTAAPGLYIHDGDGGPVTETGGWYRGNDPIPGATDLVYVVAEADRGQTLSYRQTASDRKGSRTASTKPIPVLTAGILADTFTAPDGTMLSAYVGESGQAWDRLGSANAGFSIQDGYLTGPGGWMFIRRADEVAGKYTVTARMRSVLNTGVTGHYDRGAWPAVGVKAANTGFYLRNAMNDGSLAIRRNVAGAETVLKSKKGAIPANTDYEVTMAVDGTTCTVSVNGVVVPALGFSDPALAGGGPGVWGGLGGRDHNKIDMFKVETTR